MTGRELAALVGRIGTLQVRGWTVPIEVVDAKQAYGCIRYRVIPIEPFRGSTGPQWVSADRVTLEESAS